MEADDRQVTTILTVQPSFHHRHSTNPVSWSVTIIGERAVTPHLVVRRRWQRFMILDLTSADDGMTVGLWKLSSLDGRRPPWYRPRVSSLRQAWTLALCKHFNSFLTITIAFSVMKGVLLFVFGWCERHSEVTEEMCIPLRPVPKGDTLWMSV